MSLVAEPMSPRATPRRASFPTQTSPVEPLKSSMRRNDLSFSDIFGSATNLQRLAEEHADPAAQRGGAVYGAAAKSSGLAGRSMGPVSVRREWSPDTIVCEPVGIPWSSGDDTSDEQELDACMDALHAARHERHAQIGSRRFY